VDAFSSFDDVWWPERSKRSSEYCDDEIVDAARPKSRRIAGDPWHLIHPCAITAAALVSPPKLNSGFRVANMLPPAVGPVQLQQRARRQRGEWTTLVAFACVWRAGLGRPTNKS